MRLRWSAWLLPIAALLVPSVQAAPTVAAVAPETLLSEDCVAYFRFDGIGPHRAALERTVLGQLLNEDLKPLVDYLIQLAIDGLGPDVIAQRLLSGADPDRLIELQQAAKQIPRLVEYLRQHGVVVGVEPIGLPTPGARVTLVFPDGGRDQNREAIFAGLKIAAVLNESQVKTVTIQDRQVLRLNLGDGLEIGCWQEGAHVVATIGNAPVKNAFPLNRDSDRRDLTANPLLKKVADFDEYETYARGFVDIRRGLDFLQRTLPPAAPLIEELGLNGLTSLTVQLGCRDAYQRTTITLETTGPRRGVLSPLAATADLRLDHLPPLPPDSSTVQAIGVEPVALLDGVLETIRLIVKYTAPDEVAEFEKQWQKFQRDLGIDLRSDLAGALGSTVTLSMSPSDGAFFLGSGMHVEIRDEAKLLATIERVTQSLTAGGEVNIRKKPYRDGELYLVTAANAQNFPFMPAAAIHDGWLTIGVTPQVAQGLILRSSGKFSTWQPTELTSRAVAAALAIPGTATTDNMNTDTANNESGAVSPRKIFWITQLDPRPTISQLISISNFFVLVASISEESPSFDLSLIPNAQAITERLTPNVTVATDDGRTIRFDGHASLPLGFDLSGYANLLLLAGAQFLF